MNSQKEKLIIENLFSSNDVFSRCIGIIKPVYFSPEFRPCVNFIVDYFSKYNAIPDSDTIKAETNTELKKRDITKDVFKYTCDNIERFCRKSAMKLALTENIHTIDDDNDDTDGVLFEKLKEAMHVSLQKDLGLNVYADPEERLKKLSETQLYIPSQIAAMDEHLDGGFARSQLTLFSANSGGGKSVMLANLGKYFSEAGYNVLYLSLELKEDMVYLRLGSIISKVNTKLWKQEIPKISYEINKLKEDGAGSFYIKKMPTGSTANDIRSYLKHYELEFKCVPDVLIIDYLDVMHPNEGTRGLNISEQDKLKSEQVVEILHDYNMLGFSASQQNREAIKNAAPDQGIIAGGLSKVNAVDNYISIYMDTLMRLNGQMMLFFLKTRSSMGQGQCVEVSFNPTNLIISDSKTKMSKVIEPSNSSKKKKSRADELLANIKTMPKEIQTEFKNINEGATVLIEDENGQQREVDLITLVDNLGE